MKHPTPSISSLKNSDSQKTPFIVMVIGTKATKSSKTKPIRSIKSIPFIFSTQNH